MLTLLPTVPQVQELPNEWQIGFNAYCDGLCCDEHASDQWQTGWWAALSAEAESTVEYEEDMLDRQFWSRGEW